MAKSNSISFASRFIGAAVKPGQKAFNSSRPELIASSTKDKFSLNDKAMELMGVKTNDALYFIDLATLNANVLPEDKIDYTRDERFFVAVNYIPVGETEVAGGKLGKTGVLSYSRVWSAMQIGDSEITSARPEDLIGMGLAVSRGSKKGCIATQKIAFEVSPLIDEDGNSVHVIEEGGDAIRLYSLTESRVMAHTPGGSTDEGDDDSDE